MKTHKELYIRIARGVPSWLLTIVVSAAILYLTLFPKPLGDNDIRLFEDADKVVHAIMFGALYAAIVLDLWFRRIRKSRSPNPFVSPKTAIAVAIFVSAAGGLIEVAQYLMELGRGMELADWIADTLGATLSMLLSLTLLRNPK